MPDKIVFTRDGVIGHVSKVAVGNNIGRVLMVYALLSAGLFYFAYTHFSQGKHLSAVLFSLFAVYLALGIFKSLNNSAAPVIPRDRIIRIQFVKGVPGLTRSRFEIIFKNDGGSAKKRLVMLPGSLNGEKEETAKALKIMVEENLIALR